MLIRSTSELLKSCSVEICDFFEKKKKTYILNALIQEMRLPKKSTEDYTVELEDLIYEFENVSLFPDVDSFIDMVEKQKTIGYSKLEKNYDIKFFEQNKEQ